MREEIKMLMNNNEYLQIIETIKVRSRERSIRRHLM